MTGRKKIICNNCKKEKLHFGKNLCSSCLRLHKRQTKPSFYLGTCYSEISRRCKTFDVKRPNYYGKIKCTKQEFMDKFLKDKDFLNLYKNWQINEFRRKFAPSIDRIDNNGDYILDNLRFIIHGQNAKKDWQYNIELSCEGYKTFILESQKEVARFFNTSPSTICKLFKSNSSIYYKNWFLKRINE